MSRRAIRSCCWPAPGRARSRRGPIARASSGSTSTAFANPRPRRLATIVARAAVDAEGARSIHERTGGNPLFVGETVRAYLEDGTLEWRDGRVELDESGVPRLPVTLRAVLGARIDALDPEAREVLGVASVIGIRFDAESVGQLRGDAPRRRRSWLASPTRR